MYHIFEFILHYRLRLQVMNKYILYCICIFINRFQYILFLWSFRAYLISKSQIKSFLFLIALFVWNWLFICVKNTNVLPMWNSWDYYFWSTAIFFNGHFFLINFISLLLSFILMQTKNQYQSERELEKFLYKIFRFYFRVVYRI